MSNKRKIVLPTAEEDKAITAAAMSDPDAQPMTAEQLANIKHGRGRPLGSGIKEQVTIRFDSDVIKAFREQGNGWQTRMNDALKDWLKSHPAS